MANPMKASSGTYVGIRIAVAAVSSLDYSYQGYLPSIKQQITDMALNGSGIRDTAQVLKISPTTVLLGIKKNIDISSQ